MITGQAEVGAWSLGLVGLEWHPARASIRRSPRPPGRSAAVVRLLLVAVAFVIGICGPARARGDQDDPALSEARIDAPTEGTSLTGTVEIRGRAVVHDPKAFGFYRILVGRGRTPPQMRPLDSAYERPVDGGMPRAGTSPAIHPASTAWRWPSTTARATRPPLASSSPSWRSRRRRRS